jgi:sec-independent protein translocase protein TatA
MGSLGPPELIIIGIVLVLLFGASRLPATAKGLGQALRLFKKEIRDDEKESAAAQVEKAAVQQPPVQYQQAPVQQPPVQNQVPVQQAPVQQVPVQPVPADAPNAPSAVTPGNQD